MRIALNRTTPHGRIIETVPAAQVATLLDHAQQGDTLHKLIEPLPATGAELVAVVDQQLAQKQFTRV